MLYKTWSLWGCIPRTGPWQLCPTLSSDPSGLCCASAPYRLFSGVMPVADSPAACSGHPHVRFPSVPRALALPLPCSAPCTLPSRGTLFPPVCGTLNSQVLIFYQLLRPELFPEHRKMAERKSVVKEAHSLAIPIQTGKHLTLCWCSCEADAPPWTCVLYVLFWGCVHVYTCADTWPVGLQLLLNKVMSVGCLGL